MFHGCHSLVRGWVCSPVVGVETLRFRLNKTQLPLGVCSVPKDVSTEASEAHVGTVNICATCAGVCSFAQKQPKVVFLPLVFVPDLVLGW